MSENWKRKYTDAVVDINQRELERVALLKKIKSLKEEWNIINNFCPPSAKNNGQAVVDWIGSFFKFEDRVYELEKENKKLKEEIEKLDYNLMKANAENDRINDKWADEKESFIAIISELEGQIKEEDKEEEEQPFVGSVCVDVIDSGARANEIISKGKGTLMFPSEYRKVDCCEIENWKDIRKKYDLSGRGWEVYIESNPENKRQNKEVKYKHPYFVEEGWEGAYNGGKETMNQWVTDYVYGDVYIVRRPWKTIS